MAETVLVITTEEDVTPDFLAVRVAEACARYNALRDGESVRAANSQTTYQVTPRCEAQGCLLPLNHEGDHDKLPF